MRFLGENENEPPVFLTDKLHEAFIRTLLEARSCWTIFIISDILGVDWQFNKPGTATDDNWSQRLDRPLAAYLKDPVMGPKMLLGSVPERAPESRSSRRLITPRMRRI